MRDGKVSDGVDKNWMEAVKIRVALRYNLTPEQLGRTSYHDVMWMYKTIAYEQEKLVEAGDKDGEGV